MVGISIKTYAGRRRKVDRFINFFCFLNMNLEYASNYCRDFTNVLALYKIITKIIFDNVGPINLQTIIVCGEASDRRNMYIHV